MGLDRKNVLKQRAVLSFIFFALVIIALRFSSVYGSTLDWNSQHYAFPDYFRRLFYDTGDLFPDLALNLGGGENIYDFSYYGLFSPVILLSYLFPFLRMYDYIQLASILGAWISLMLMHRLLCRHFSSFTSFAGALAFVFTAPFLFNSHRHIMFVSYMPFMIMAYMSADKFISDNKKTFLIISSTLMMLCCYFFSITALLSLCVYIIYRYLSFNKNFSISDFFKKGAVFAGCMLTSVMICCILFLPSIAALANGRDKQDISFDYTILIPRLIQGVSGISPHAFGISVFAVISITAAVLSKDKARRFLGIFIAVINIFPVIILFLNGGMYVEGKVLIPFIPILIIIICHKLEEYRESTSEKKIVYIISAVIIAESLLLYQTSYDAAKFLSFVLTAADIISFLIFWRLYSKKQRKRYLICSAVFISAIVTALSGIWDSLMPYDIMDYDNSSKIYEMAEVIASDEELYRSSLCARKAETVNMIYDIDYYSPYVYSSVHNKLYNDFYFKKIHNENEYRNSALTTRSSNILFNIFMGNKYLITNKKTAETGFELIRRESPFGLYKNENVLPIGRSSKNIISREYFESLSPVEQMEAIVKYIVVEDSSINNKCVFTNEQYELPKLPESARIRCDGNEKYNISSEVDFSFDLLLDRPIPKNKLLIITFNIDNSMTDDDARIKINNVKNTMTSQSWKYCNNNDLFEYVISTDGAESINKLKLGFSKGDYSISNIESFLIDYPYDIELTGSFKADKTRTKGDMICGSIECSEDSFFELTVPYDNGFEINVDGKHQDYEIADTAFIGFYLSKGRHDIEIEYHAPLKKEGMIVSIAGIAILAVIAIYEYIIKKRFSHSG